jgi:hypothetical protein
MADKDDVLTLARERFKRCVEHTAENRRKQRDDIRFAAASPDDPWQWPEKARKDRETSQRPCLTINKLPQHMGQVTNDIRQNRPSIRYRAASSDADAETAEILNGIARHIEAISDADVAYDTAAQNVVAHGEGYWRLLTDYVSETSFDQDIFIRRIKDPFKVYMDPDCEDPCGSDAQFCFIEESLDEDEFKAQYPKADPIDWDFETYEDWFTHDRKIRVAEYWTLERKEALLGMFANGATSFQGDPLPPGVMPGEVPIKTRKVHRTYVCWRKIAGNQELDKREYKFQYIPIVRVIGNEWIVDGKMVVSGLVRNTKDASRMYNVAASAITERVMLSPKAPWAGPAEAFDGFESYWDTANTANHSRLPYNHLDEQGNPLPPPQRVAPATVEPGLQQILLQAADDIKATSGQFDASLGAKSNETSGKAILARQREGDTATFHYADNIARGVRHTGRIILSMIPTVYDQPRVMRIIGEDGSEEFARLDPQMPRAYQDKDDAQAIERAFNPLVGVYDVVASAGPSFTTRRIEAVQAMTEMTQANPSLWNVIGDHLVRNMDWPGADEMAKRLKAVLLPQVLQAEEGNDEIPPQAQAVMQQMQQQIQELSSALEEAAKAAENTQQKAQIDAWKAEIEKYKAETERMQVLAPAVGPEQVQAIVLQTVQEILNTQAVPMGEPMELAPEPMEPVPQ